MQGKSIVITSGKGGVGKTTTTANVGAALALKGKKVCLIDADIGLRNLDVVLGLENRIVYDLVDVVEDRCRLEQALVGDKKTEDLYLLPAAQTRDKEAVSEEQISEVIEELKKEMDYVLVDSPAGIEQGFRNAISGVDRAVIIATPEVSAVRDADRIIGLLEAEGVNDPELVINRIKKDMVDRGDMMNIDDMLEILAVDILGVVPEEEKIVVSTNTGEPIVHSNNSQAGQAFKNISRRIEGEDLPLMDLKDDSFINRIKNFIGW
ncbi:septum site-determining protein MinD [Halarsenatibacter silvermanii]|uniref:Septum site-determining protein MinD n=1 Tax=Halarsenatibacter silvermanii TaxID=321763 RepID=A0A1G9PB94_9FIRM|nr:septum site-determining protein MinD [Halarsenatibacter silvermanii]SDL96040.1 septum site-determining protein MinD [Halarsenatibacter silvermanii]